MWVEWKRRPREDVGIARGASIGHSWWAAMEEAQFPWHRFSFAQGLRAAHDLVLDHAVIEFEVPSVLPIRGAGAR